MGWHQSSRTASTAELRLGEARAPCSGHRCCCAAPTDKARQENPALERLFAQEREQASGADEPERQELRRLPPSL
ncbi:MAG: hypothetical protein ACLVJH_15295 [Faecalibacterium prausnitzii]